MKKILSLLFIISMLIYSCAEKPKINHSNFEPEYTIYKIGEKSLKLQELIKDKFINHKNFNTSNSVSIVNSLELENFCSQFNLKGDDDSVKNVKDPKFVILYNKGKILTKDVGAGDIIGLGLINIVDDKYMFRLFETDSAGDFDLISSCFFPTVFPTQVFNYIRYDLKNSENIKSLQIFISDSKTSPKVLDPKDFSYLSYFERFVSNTEIDYRDGCGCPGVDLCCIDEGCDPSSEFGYYCSIQPDEWGGNQWSCYRCGDIIAGTCIVKKVKSELSIVDSHQTSDFIPRAYKVQKFLSKYEKGRKYINAYYQLSDYLIKNNFLELFTNNDNWEFAKETLDIGEKLVFGSNSDIIITDRYVVIASKFLNKYQGQEVNNEMNDVFEFIKVDLKEYLGKTRSQILTNF